MCFFSIGPMCASAVKTVFSATPADQPGLRYAQRISVFAQAFAS